MKRGLLIVFTGNSGNNTICAVGQVLRALGAGLKVCVVQCNSESRQYRELAYIQQYFPRLAVHSVSLDQSHLPITEPRRQSEECWKNTATMIDSYEFDMLVLLEPSWLIDHNVVREEELLDTIRERPASLVLIVAGGRLLDPLVQEADVVTEVNDVKAP